MDRAGLSSVDESYVLVVVEVVVMCREILVDTVMAGEIMVVVVVIIM